MTIWRVPLFDADFGPDEEAAVLRPLRAGWLTMGEEVLLLEQELCEASGARHAVAVTNCTAALHLACAALGVGPGDEVVCPTLTFVASANAPRSLGADVRLCESVGEDDLTMDPASLRALLGPRTKAVVAVHYAGFACRMEEVLAAADARGVPVIEDCAHALFTTYRGKTLGLHGRVGCFSFFSNKNITCGEGGALLTDDGALADELRRLRSHGMTSPTLERHKGRAYSYDVTAAGFNYRLDEIRAALLRAQLRRLPGFLRRRRELFSHYADRLRDTPIRLPFRGERHRRRSRTRPSTCCRRCCRPTPTARPSWPDSRRRASRRASTTRRSTPSRRTASRVRICREPKPWRVGNCPCPFTRR